MAEDFSWKRDVKLQARLSAEVEALAKLPSNATCADCAESKRIRFCSVTLGVFLCNRCYGLHRALGAHVTRGKCLGLDAWKPEEVELLRSMGNARARSLYEANVPPGFARPTAGSADREVAAWIRDKYERKKYFASGTTESAMPSSVVNVAPAGAPMPPQTAAASARATEDLLGDFLSPSPLPSSCASQPSAAVPSASTSDWMHELAMPPPAAPLQPSAGAWQPFDLMPAAPPMVQQAPPNMMMPMAAFPAAQASHAPTKQRSGGLSNDDILALFNT